MRAAYIGEGGGALTWYVTVLHWNPDTIISHAAPLDLKI